MCIYESFDTIFNMGYGGGVRIVLGGGAIYTINVFPIDV